MKKYRFYALLCMLLAVVLLADRSVPVKTAMAETVTLEVQDAVAEYALSPEQEKAAKILEENLRASGISLRADRRLYDFYGKFTVTEQEEIGAYIAEQEEKSNISIRVFVAEMSMEDEKSFLEACADALCDNGYAKEDLAVMLLNLDVYDRGVCIQGYGSCETRLNDDRIEYILDDIIEWFSEGDYVYGVKLFAEEAAYYATATDTVNSSGSVRPVGSVEYVPYYEDNSLKGKLSRMPWPFLVIAPAAVTVIGILLMIQNSGSKRTATGRTYMEQSTSGLTAQRDDYLRTAVSKTYSPRNTSSSVGGSRSSGGGGRSGGGRSHSGGSRRF